MTVKNTKLSFICIAAVILCIRILSTSPAPVGKRMSVECGAGNDANYASILPGIVVTLNFLQEKILPRPSDISENLLDELWTSLDALLQLDHIINQTASQDSILGPFLNPLSEQMQLWIGSTQNCSATSGCSREKVDALRSALQTYKKLQLALQSLQEMANEQGLDTVMSESDWVRRYVLCSGKATNGTVLVVSDLGYNITSD